MVLLFRLKTGDAPCGGTRYYTTVTSTGVRNNIIIYRALFIVLKDTLHVTFIHQRPGAIQVSCSRTHGPGRGLNHQPADRQTADHWHRTITELWNNLKMDIRFLILVFKRIIYKTNVEGYECDWNVRMWIYIYIIFFLYCFSLFYINCLICLIIII